MTLWRLIRTDLLKQKRSPLWLIVLLIPLGTTAAMFLDMYLRYDPYLIHQATKMGLSSWEMLLLENHQSLAWSFFLPFFVAVIAEGVHYTEFQQNNWKFQLSLPVKKGSVLVSKFVVILMISFVLIALNSLGLIGVGLLTGFPEPIDYGLYGNYLVYQMIGILGIISIHNWLSSYFANGIKPLAIGVFGMILGVMGGSKEPLAIKLVPYLHPYLADGLLQHDPVTMVPWSLGIGGLILALSIIEFSRRDIV